MQKKKMKKKSFIGSTPSLKYLLCVSRIVAFIVKKKQSNAFFAFFIGKLDSSHVEI